MNYYFHKNNQKFKKINMYTPWYFIALIIILIASLLNRSFRLKQVIERIKSLKKNILILKEKYGDEFVDNFNDILDSVIEETYQEEFESDVVSHLEEIVSENEEENEEMENNN